MDIFLPLTILNVCMRLLVMVIFSLKSVHLTLSLQPGVVRLPSYLKKSSTSLGRRSRNDTLSVFVCSSPLAMSSGLLNASKELLSEKRNRKVRYHFCEMFTWTVFRVLKNLLQSVLQESSSWV